MSRSNPVVLLLAAALVACSPPPKPQEPVRAVKLLTVGQTTLTANASYAGEVRARVESRLGFRVGGKLVARHVELGQKVKAGQLLAEMDAQDYRLSVDAARAQVNAAQTNRDLAAADLKRYKELRDKGFISGAELERRESGLKAAQAQLEQAQAQLAAQGNQLGYSKLIADKAGVVTGVEAEAGQVLSAGMPVVRLAQEGQRDAVFAVPEDQLSQLKMGLPLQVKFWGQDALQEATVREISASADPVTRTFTVRATLRDSSAALGSTLTVFLNNTAAPTQAINLPTTAIRQEGGQTTVWVLDTTSMTVRAQVVQVQTIQGNDVILKSGLQPGQQIVAAGVHVLSPGQKVSIYQAPGAQP
jgi:membrane fusion protein, multidrug efflux system